MPEVNLGLFGPLQLSKQDSNPEFGSQRVGMFRPLKLDSPFVSSNDKSFVRPSG